MIPEEELRTVVEKIRTSRKYRDMDLPEETIRDLIAQEYERYGKKARSVQSAKAKLHNITALYLGDPDYKEAKEKMDAAFEEGLRSIEQFCREILEKHDSTRERLPYMESFYKAILSVCPAPEHILDLACGMNPFALPFMGLPEDCAYHAYDIHRPRVALINRFFRKLGRVPLAEVRDINIHPPDLRADAAFLFKEAHRMEKRRPGTSRDLVFSLNIRFIFLSLPNRSLDGQRDLSARMGKLAGEVLGGIGSRIQEIPFPGETIYWSEKTDAR